MDFIFDAIDALLNPNATNGLGAILNRNKYVLVKDEKGELICLSHKIDMYKQLIEGYLKTKGFNKNLFKFEIKSLKREELERIINYKIVLLDEELVLYKEVVEKAQNYSIKGYTGKTPKYGINKYKTIPQK